MFTIDDIKTVASERGGFLNTDGIKQSLDGKGMAEYLGELGTSVIGYFDAGHCGIVYFWLDDNVLDISTNGYCSLARPQYNDGKGWGRCWIKDAQLCAGRDGHDIAFSEPACEPKRWSKAVYELGTRCWFVNMRCCDFGVYDCDATTKRESIRSWKLQAIKAMACKWKESVDGSVSAG